MRTDTGDATPYDLAERPHPRPLLSADAIAALYAGQRYADQPRTVLDNTPFTRPLRRSPLASTMTDL